MASQDRALVAALRAELAALEPTRPCDRRAEMAGLGTAAVRGDRPALARLLVRLSRDPDGASGRQPPFHWETAADHCRAAFLRGRFLARGSLSLSGGRPHLEFGVPAEEAAPLAAQLAVIAPGAGVRLRRGRGVVTWKSGEAIGTFLRWIGANATLLEIESRQVGRSVRGELNRLINAESANLERIASAAARQLEAIATLTADGRIETLPSTVREVASGRVRTPEASLAELAAELELPRGRVQRALARIEALALQAPDPGGPARGAERPAALGPGAPSPGARGVA